MADLEHEIQTVESYTKLLMSASENGRFTDLEHIKEQMDSFDDDTEKLTQLCRDIDKLEAERADLRKLIEELKSRKEELGELEKRYEQMNEPLEYSESKQKKMFEKYLGLQFRLTKDHAISLVFTNVDPNDYERKFAITVDIDEQDQWKVVHMDPILHGVRPLVSALNETSNFGQFCKHIRQKFQQLCTEPTTATSTD